jgi:hypothetical protein
MSSVTFAAICAMMISFAGIKFQTVLFCGVKGQAVRRENLRAIEAHFRIVSGTRAVLATSTHE